MLFTGLLWPGYASAASLFSLTETAPGAMDDFEPSGVPLEVGDVQLNLDVLDQLGASEQVFVSLPGAEVVEGIVQPFTFGEKGEQPTLISFPDGGGLELAYDQGRPSEMTVVLKGASYYYHADLDQFGRGVLLGEDLNNLMCAEMPVHDDGAEAELIAEQREDLALNTLKKLQSKPGASKVVFINYWGGVESQTAWTTYYNGGEDIEYSAYDRDSNPADFNLSERNNMWLGWAEVAEDYAAFDVNITTDVDVYDATPNADRVQVAATRTNYFYTGAGGVAYVGVFNRTNDYSKTSWAWNSSASSLGMTMSHEVGHQVGLWHDGTVTGATYYRGHGTWGPVMGAPFGKGFVQFSRGEYPDANRQDDDLVIIANVLGEVQDDAGDDQASAYSLQDSFSSILGNISPQGLGAADVDYYRFTLDTAVAVDLAVRPWVAEPSDWNTYGTNLSMRAELSDSAGNVLGLVYPNANPRLNSLEYSGLLQAGDYYIKISAESYDSSWSTGFGEYANAGKYRLVLSRDADQPPGIASLIAPHRGVTETSPIFRWTAESSADQYRVLVYDRDEGETIYVGDLSAADLCIGSECELQANDIALRQDGRYLWRVRARNSAGWGGWSAVMTFDVRYPVPGTVQPIAPSGQVNETSPVFTWHAIDHVASYRVLVYDRVSGEIAHLQTHDAAALCGEADCTLSDGGIALNFGKNHFWRVRARNSSGWGPWSEIQRFSVVPTAPGTVAQLSPVGEAGSSGPAFVWNADDTADLYRVLIYDNTIGSSVYLANQAASDVCESGVCTLEGVATMSAGNNHFWRVRGKNQGGWGPWSAPLRFNVDEALIAPALYAPVGSVHSDTPYFSWEKLAGTAQYRLQVFEAADGTSVLQQVLGAASACNDLNCVYEPTSGVLNADSSYYWQVQAGLADGWGGLSLPRAFDYTLASGGCVTSGVGLSFESAVVGAVDDAAFPPSNLADGCVDATHSWSGLLGTQIVLDAGYVQQMRGIYLWSTFAREESVIVETSIDGVSWAEESDTTLTQAVSGPVFYGFSSPGPVRYVRITSNGSALNDWTNLTEVRWSLMGYGAS